MKYLLLIYLISLLDQLSIAESKNYASSNEPCADSILNKKTWDEKLGIYPDTKKELFSQFDVKGNLTVYGNIDKRRRKTGEWYFFSSNICDSICWFEKNKRIS